jgi:hypothetical protein
MSDADSPRQPPDHSGSHAEPARARSSATQPAATRRPGLRALVGYFLGLGLAAQVAMWVGKGWQGSFAYYWLLALFG